MSEQIVKMYQFKLNADAPEATFLAASADLDSSIKDHEGFLYRTVAKQTDGVWQDIIYWGDAVAAAKMAEEFEKSAAAGVFMSLIDMSSVKVTESTIITSTCNAEASEKAA